MSEQTASALQSEIERKFLVTEFPSHITPLSVFDIEQTYIGMGASDELRVRKLTDVHTGKITYTFTFKKGSNTVDRLEFEQPISQALYESVMENVDVKSLCKRRTTLAHGKYQIEIDSYRQFDFIVAEVEFPNVEEMKAFNPPLWCREKISGNKTYSNKYLWKSLQT